MNDDDANVLENLAELLVYPGDLRPGEERPISDAVALIGRLAAEVERLTSENIGLRRCEEGNERSERITGLLVRKQKDKISTLKAVLDRLSAENALLTDENARLSAEVERLTPRWSSERPKVEGRYFVRGETIPFAVEYFDAERIKLFARNSVSQNKIMFAGPIVTSEERSEAR